MKANHWFTFIITLISLSSTAQNFELGGFAGTSHYQGDLVKGIVSVGETKYCIGGYTRMNVNPFFAFRLQYNFAKISGSDKRYPDDYERSQRNLDFKSPLHEISLTFEYNILGYTTGSYRRYPGLVKTKFTPYLILGVSGFYFNPTSEYKGQTYNLQEYETEAEKSYSLMSVSIPMGLGVKYNFKRGLTFAFEIVYHKTFTDYLDDVSGKFANYNKVLYSQGEAAAHFSDRSRELEPRFDYQKNELVNRGNPLKLDAYTFVGFSISKRLGRR